MTDRQMQLWHWLCRQGPKVVLATFSSAKINPDDLFFVVGSMKHDLEKTTSRKLKTAKPLEELARIHELRFDRMKKVKKAKGARKARLIERQYYVIQSLRGQGASWNDILVYLKRYNKIDITRQYLCKTMKELDAKYTVEEG